MFSFGKKKDDKEKKKKEKRDKKGIVSDPGKLTTEELSRLEDISRSLKLGKQVSHRLTSSAPSSSFHRECFFM